MDIDYLTMGIDWSKAKSQLSNLEKLLNKIKKQKEQFQTYRDIVQIKNDLLQLELDLNDLEDQITYYVNECYKDVVMQAQQMQININHGRDTDDSS